MMKVFQELQSAEHVKSLVFYFNYFNDSKPVGGW